MELRPYTGKSKATAADPARTTVPGYRNPHRQVVIRRTGLASSTFRGQTIYELRCGDCRRAYGANGCDIHARRCPHCQSGTPGEPVPEQPASLFDVPAAL